MENIEERFSPKSVGPCADSSCRPTFPLYQVGSQVYFFLCQCRESGIFHRRLKTPQAEFTAELN